MGWGEHAYPPKDPKCQALSYARPPTPLRGSQLASAQNGGEAAAASPSPLAQTAPRERNDSHCFGPPPSLLPGHVSALPLPTPTPGSSPGQAGSSDKLNLTRPELSSSRSHLPHWSPAHRCAHTPPLHVSPWEGWGEKDLPAWGSPVASWTHMPAHDSTWNPAQGQQCSRCLALRAEPGGEKPSLLSRDSAEAPGLVPHWAHSRHTGRELRVLLCVWHCPRLTGCLHLWACQRTLGEAWGATVRPSHT